MRDCEKQSHVPKYDFRGIGERFSCVALLQTCKQLLESGGHILYQSNTFRFFLDKTTKAFCSGLMSSPRTALYRLYLIVPFETATARPRELGDLFMPQDKPALILLSLWLKTHLKGLSTLTIELDVSVRHGVRGMLYLDAVMGENRGLKLDELYLRVRSRGTRPSTLVVDDTNALERDLRHLLLDVMNGDSLAAAAVSLPKTFLKGDSEHDPID